MTEPQPSNFNVPLYPPAVFLCNDFNFSHQPSRASNFNRFPCLLYFCIVDMDILEVGNGVLTPDESKAHFSLWVIMKSPLLIGCDMRTAACQASVPLFTNEEVLAISQDPLGVQAERVYSFGPQGVPVGKSGTCGTEELPQNTIIAPCNANDPFQAWSMLPNGTLFMAATGECLQLDSGQGGCCSQAWTVWTNNAASGLCNDPASCCGAKQQLWNFNSVARTLTNNVSGQCLSVHAGGMHNVGVTPCTPLLAGLQTWDVVATTGQFISSAAPPGSSDTYCLARTKDVRGGAVEVWAGPLVNNGTVVLLFNRNTPGVTNVTAAWGYLGIPLAQRMAVRDVWAKADLGVFAGAFTAPVNPHGVVLLRMSPVA